MSPPFVRNSSQLWTLFRQAETFSCRPSELLGIEDAYLAYCIDGAVYEFGVTLKNELESIEGKSKQEIKNKQDRLLRKWLDLPQQYRNPGMVGPGSRDD